MKNEQARSAAAVACAVGIIAACLAICGSSYAATIYGGPTYDAVSGSGFSRAYQGRAVQGGMATGFADKYVDNVAVGYRALRWGSSGFQELDTLSPNTDGYVETTAYGVNAAGAVVGYSSKWVSGVFKGYRAVRWDPSSASITELGNLGTDDAGYTVAVANAINNSNVVVGHAQTTAGVAGDRAVRWDAAGNATSLANLAPNVSNAFVDAVAVNSSGTAAGYSQKYVSDVGQGFRAVRWDASGTAATELGNLGTASTVFSDTYTDSKAAAMNDAGTIVGFAAKYAANSSNLGDRAVRWDAGGTDATELAGLGTGLYYEYANAINASGVIVGRSGKYIGDDYFGNRAVKWNPAGTVAIELGDLGVDPNGVAESNTTAINDTGTIVGYADAYDAAHNNLGQRAVMWNADGTAIDLSTFVDPASGWRYLKIANDISHDNWLSGVGRFDPDGAGPLPAYERLFLLQVPEPAMITPLIGAAAMCLGRKRRGRSLQ